MNLEAIFGTQFLLSLLVFGLAARWFVTPWLDGMRRNAALVILVLPHTLRHIGLSFFVPGLVDSPLAASFANPAAYGDLISGLLAILALVALRGNWRVSIPLVWIFNVFGTVDLFNALRQAEVISNLGTTWFIPTFIVPVLLVSHAMIFARLIQRRSEPLSHPA